ncbi:unnamed protein product [Aphanomyces euteiches]
MALADALESISSDDFLTDGDDIDAMILDDINVFNPSATITIGAEILSASPLLNDNITTLENDVSFKPRSNDPRKRQREEIEYLRLKVEELEQHLVLLQQVKSLDSDTETPWQKIACKVRIVAKNSINENERLKHELQEHIKFCKTLQALMRKKPKLTTLPTLECNQWRLNRLVKDPTLRRQAIHAICEHHYELTELTMLESGLIDQTNEYVSYIPRLSKINEELVMQVAFRTTKTFDFNVMSELIWGLFRGRLESMSSSMSCQTVEIFDETSIKAHCLYKRYTDSDRHVIVGRTILDDEVHPFQDGELVLNKSVWVILEKLDNGSACRMNFTQKCTLPMVQSRDGIQTLADHDAISRFCRVGGVTDSIMLSLKTMTRDFSQGVDLILDKYTGNIDDTFNLVNEFLKVDATVTMGNKPSALIHSAQSKKRLKAAKEEKVRERREDSDDVDRSKSNKLLKAAEEGDVDKVHELLEDGADVNFKNEDEQTPLHEASANGYVDVVKVLIAHGATVDTTDRVKHDRILKESHGSEQYRKTPLYRACSAGHFHVVQELLTHGADVNIADKVLEVPFV